MKKERILASGREFSRSGTIKRHSAGNPSIQDSANTDAQKRHSRKSRIS
jgi:hypothetical protein